METETWVSVIFVSSPSVSASLSTKFLSWQLVLLPKQMKTDINNKDLAISLALK